MKPTKPIGETKTPAEKGQPLIIGGVSSKFEQISEDIVTEDGIRKKRTVYRYKSEPNTLPSEFKEEIINEVIIPPLSFRPLPQIDPPTPVQRGSGKVKSKRKSGFETKIKTSIYKNTSETHDTDFVDQPAEQPKVETPTPSERPTEHFNALTRQLEELGKQSSEFRQGIMPQLQDAVNASMQHMPYHTIDEKNKIAEWANAEVASYGLAIKCPKSGKPAKLLADVGNWPGVGRFQIFAMTPDGKRHRTSSDTPPNLTLMELVPAERPELQEPGSSAEPSWKTTVGPAANRGSRKRS